VARLRDMRDCFVCKHCSHVTGVPKVTVTRLRYIGTQLVAGGWRTRSHKLFHIRKVLGVA